MNIEDKHYAEKALKRLFIGSQLDGVKFGAGSGTILIRFMHYTNQEPDDLWINIESKWTVFPSETIEFPQYEKELKDLTEEEEYDLVFMLRREKVIDIKLGIKSPHLFIVFQSGKILFVNGHHEMYECWQAGDGAGYTGEDCFIVAVPGDNIAVWASENFLD